MPPPPFPSGTNVAPFADGTPSRTDEYGLGHWQGGWGVVQGTGKGVAVIPTLKYISQGHSECANFVRFGTFGDFFFASFASNRKHVIASSHRRGYVEICEICEKRLFQKCMGGWVGGHIFQHSATHWTVHTNMALHR